MGLSVSGTSTDQDTAFSHIYWTDEQNRIRRANLDGSNIETLISSDENETSVPFGLALDVDGGKIYWTEKLGRNDGRIRRANLDGSDIETLIPSPSSEFYSPSDIALDVDGGKMYWMNDATILIRGNIRRANLDGSNIETLITGLSAPSDLALDVDGGKIYWTDRDDILRANLDGSDIETLITGLSALDIALDMAGGKIYWTDRDDIWYANLDGSNIETLTTGLDARIYSIALGPYYKLADPEETRTRSPEEARSELAERGIPYNQSSFVTYAQNGDLDVVRLFVEAGLDVNVQPHSSYYIDTGGVYIIGQEDVEQLDDLEAVWFPQGGDEYNDTALMKAAGQGHREVVRFLVEQGADLNIRNNQGQNALMFAAASGHLAVVIFLIDNGARATSRGFFYSYEDGPYTP